MQHREEKISSLLTKLISQYIAKLDTEKILVTVTSVSLSKDLKSAKIFISAYPDENEEKIMEIIEKEKSEIIKYIASNTKMKFLPKLEFEIDKGEKNRQKIEELLKKSEEE